MESRSRGQESGTESSIAANRLKTAVRGGWPESEAAAACECDEMPEFRVPLDPDTDIDFFLY